jgi:3-mercaptopyruvate sulfurtransferase SseA
MPRDVLTAIEAAMVIDVRSPDPYAAGHAPCSSLMPVHALLTLSGRREEAKEQPLVVYCERSPHTSFARTTLGRASYSWVIYLIWADTWVERIWIKKRIDYINKTNI